MQYTNDPVADHYAYDAECGAWEKECPKCEICGKPTLSEDLHDTSDGLVCHECFMENYLDD